MKKTVVNRALISVYDKTGIVDFARALVTEFGIEIISTGGTATLLKKEGIPVTLVEEVTGFPELMDGRVKTLHPKIHAGILADRDNPEHMRQLEQHGIKPIDMVVVNLYPFEKTVANPNCTFEQAIEMIDIGGPCLLRAAAKNHKHVIVVPIANEEYFNSVLDRFRSMSAANQAWDAKCDALNAFWKTCSYDASVAGWLSRGNDGSQHFRCLTMWRTARLRYGENPHQKGDAFHISDSAAAGPKVRMGSGHYLSFNNLTDSHAALELCMELTRAHSNRGGDHTCVFVKHMNPCGIGVSGEAIEAYRKAYRGDPNAAMGGVLVCNFPIDGKFARVVMETYDRWGKDAGAGGFFVEVWAAPEFSSEVTGVVRGAKGWGERVRFLDVGNMGAAPDTHAVELRSITGGGMLVQTPDLVALNEDQWKVATKRQPTDAELADLRLAWLIAKHTKSNAISLCKDGMLIGNGAGQMSRVMSCRIATWLAKENGHADKLAGSVAASDAFFPFPDGPEILLDAGVTALIQPGGSKRDAETIKLCDERNAAMIFTGTRHFKH